jgi:outer membrane biosynthesis protein TonB
MKLKIFQIYNGYFEKWARHPMKFSLVLHFFVIIILSVTFTSSKIPEISEKSYSVEILPVTQVTNIKTKTANVDIKKNIVVKEKKIIPKSQPIKAVEKKEEVVKKVDKSKKVVVPKKEEVKKNQTKEKKPQKEDPLDSLLKNLQETSQQKSETKEKIKDSSKGSFDDKIPLSMSIQDDIIRQISKCWSPPAGSMDAGSITVLLLINLEIDGTVANVKVINEGLKSNDHIRQAAMQAAIRAVKKCSPLQGLPVKLYDSWKELEFYFDPRELIY